MNTNERAVVVLALCLALPAGLSYAEDAPTAQESGPKGEKLPVILLTGFEPFGPGRPPNPSWEGVKRLDGEEWRGHRLVARQLPVVWGAPLPHLAKWIDELQPAAVFSFGQGGGYALETLASNQRGGGADNRGEQPAQREIVAGGARELKATIDAPGLAERLAERGHRVAISREAGDYLCEECLYSLEHLKATRKLAAPVLFCHIPPLQNKRYTPADAEQFVRDMLESWHALSARSGRR